MRSSIGLCLLLLSGAVLSHEMTPTYPKWGVSGVDDVKKTTMRLWNAREDVQYYEIGVFTEKWKPIPFVTAYRIISIDYLKEVNFDVYIKEEHVIVLPTNSAVPLRHGRDEERRARSMRRASPSSRSARTAGLSLCAMTRRARRSPRCCCRRAASSSSPARRTRRRFSQVPTLSFPLVPRNSYIKQRLRTLCPFCLVRSRDPRCCGRWNWGTPP